MKFLKYLILATTASNVAYAAPAKTTLKDYAYDFTSIGYEIVFSAETSYFSDPMSPDDYFKVSADGYTLKARSDKLSRNGRKQFTTYFNENCKFSFNSRAKCMVILTGEVELDEDFQMII